MGKRIAIIGAGAGGILSIAKLLDSSVRPHDIIWIDPYFNVGRIGDKYRTVESNDEVWEWHSVLEKYKCLTKYTRLLRGFEYHRNENLSVIADILTRITHDFQRLPITCIRDTVTDMKYDPKHNWKLYFRTHRRIRATHVILSTGSHPKGGPANVQCPDNNSICGREVIPLDQALNINILKTLIHPDECVVIVGSGQSAVLLMKYLAEMNVKAITNVYRHSLQQTIASLRGGTKRWALAHMGNIIDVLSNYKEAKRPIIEQTRRVDEILGDHTESKRYLFGVRSDDVLSHCGNAMCPVIRVRSDDLLNDDRKDDIIIQRVHESEIGNVTCAKLIYATGYERNDLPKCNIQLNIDNPDGILGPSIYGIGIAFPDIDHVGGNVMKRVGLTSFSRSLDRRLPLWSIL